MIESNSRGVEDIVNRGNRKRIARAAVIGHAIEWYEFSVYGVMAAYIAVAVFPSSDLVTSLTLTWATFSIAFLIRPLGGVLFAHLSDRVSRRTTLFATVLLMTFATAGIALVPSYVAVGPLAPVLFLGLRVLQGLAVGGEMSSAVPYLTEATPPQDRPRAVSWLAASTFASALSGALIAAVLAALLGSDAMSEWGWRLPFFLALPLGALAVLVRSRAPEGGEYSERPRSGTVVASPLRVALRDNWRRIILYVAVALTFNVALAACLSGYLSEVILHGLQPAEALLVTIGTYVSLITTILLSAPLSNRWGRRRVLSTGAVGAALFVVPELLLGQTGSPPLATLGGALLAVPTGIMAVPVYLTLSEFFPAAVRSTAGGIGFNVAVAISSLVPFTTLLLRSQFGIEFGLAVWVVTSASIALLAVGFGWRWTNHVD